MKSKIFILSSVFVFSSTLAMVESVPADDDLRASVLAKAGVSRNGVIMALSPSGDVAAHAALLLANQMPHNSGFEPLLMVAENNRLQGYLDEFKLSSSDLPALVFFNKSGKEIGRVVATQTTMTKMKEFLQNGKNAAVARF